MMMRRLVNGGDIAPLKTLVDLIEPVKIYQRYQQRPQTMLSPLTGLIDIARADAPDARRFNTFVATLASEKSCSEKAPVLASIFERWTAAGTALEPLMAVNPGLAEARQLGADLRELGEIGGEFVRGLGSGSLTREWRDAKAKRLDEIAKPKAALEFQVVAGMRKLVSGACEKQ
jgi:hexosaminidase